MYLEWGVVQVDRLLKIKTMSGFWVREPKITHHGLTSTRIWDAFETRALEGLDILQGLVESK